MCRKRVFEVMSQLGLVDIADSRIGSNEKRGISGGKSSFYPASLAWPQY